MLDKVVHKYNIASHVCVRTSDLTLLVSTLPKAYLIVQIYADKALVHKVPLHLLKKSIGEFRSVQQAIKIINRTDFDLQPYLIETMKMKKKAVKKKAVDTDSKIEE